MVRPLRRSLLALAMLVLAPSAHAAITQPPSGDNQKSTVIQHVGLVTVRVDYSSPDVHGPNGEDRTGKIWGELVPYGMHDLGYNNCKECPWRAGANENTVVTVSHDVKVEGKDLPAGAYGLHMIAGKDEWTVIFSRNSSAWGSFFYDPKDDQLRVTVKPRATEYHEWLTYEFTERKPETTTLALRWEKLEVPIVISVPNATELYLAQMRRDLDGEDAFSWVNWDAAAQFALARNTNLAEAETWAKRSIEDPFGGNANLTTLGTLAQVQLANGKTADAQKTLDRILALPADNPVTMHQFARRLQMQGKNAEAMKVFQANAKKFPGRWPTDLGLARGANGTGDTKAALAHAKKALTQAPDEPNRKNVEAFIRQLETQLAGGAK